MLKNKKIVLIGANGLIGRYFAKAILNNHADVILADINLDGLEKLKVELSEEYPTQKCLTVELNINSKSSILNAIQHSKALFGMFDAMVNTSYPRTANHGRSFLEMDYDDFCESLSIHLGGFFLASQQFAKYFLENQIEGNIVNMSSIYGVVTPRYDIYSNTNMTNPPDYAAIKSGLIHLTKYMAKSLKNSKIRFNCISPGGILDNQPESFLEKYQQYCLSKGMLNAEDISGTLIFLLSDFSKYINGQNLIVDDGFVL